MKIAKLLSGIALLSLALPATAATPDKIGDWSLDRLCAKKDSSRVGDAVTGVSSGPRHRCPGPTTIYRDS